MMIIIIITILIIELIQESGRRDYIK